MNKDRVLHFLIPVVIAIAVFLGYLAVRNHMDSEESRVEYSLYDGQTVRLVIGSRLLSLIHPPIIRDNEIALDIDTIRRYIDKTVNWDKANKRVTVTTRDKLVRMNTDSLTALVNDRQEIRLDLPVFEEDGVVYLPLKFLSDFFQIRVDYNEKNKAVIVDDRRAVVQAATVVENNAVIRLGRSIKEPIVKSYPNVRADKKSGGNLANGGTRGVVYAVSMDGGGNADAGAETVGEADDGGDAGTDDAGGEDAGYIDDGDGSIDDGKFDMYVFEDYGDWYKVRSIDGIVGYIERKFVAVRRYVDKSSLVESGNTAWKPDGGKIIMVWESVSSARANPDTSRIPEMPGLDIVSPTWLNLADDQGTVESSASASYIDWAHAKGYHIWVLFANRMNDIEMTSRFLNNSLAREHAIRSVLAYAAVLGVDGINLDFENVYLKDRDVLTQFVRELAALLRAQGLAFSVDVNVPDGSDTWSRCYDTPAIAAAADYINLMAYDQTGARSHVSGSVSQLSWVEANLKKLIERDGVPPEKILLGIPFYTRVWEMEGADTEPGDRTKDSSAVGMKTAIGGVLDNNAEVEWDEESGQFFCKYKKDGKSYQVWLEDPNSANLRSSLVHKYSLAGVSAWSRTFVIPEIWDVLSRNLKDYTTYYQWRSEAFPESPALAQVQ